MKMELYLHIVEGEDKLNPCEVGFKCPNCVIDYYGDLCCTCSVLIGGMRQLRDVDKCKCPLIEESSELYEWLQVMDDPTVQLAIEKANKVLHDRAIHRRMKIEEQEKKVDRDDPF